MTNNPGGIRWHDGTPAHNDQGAPGGVPKYGTVIDTERLLQAAEEQMLGDGNAGFCTACGEERDGCEPDARNYPCEACGANKVYGASELLLMGWVPGL